MELISSQNSPFECILFDLDDTLYDGEIGIHGFLKKNIEDFLSIKCKVSPEKAFSLRSEFFCSHGSSLAALLALGYDIHPDEYHSYVHGKLPYELIQPDTSLLHLLRSIHQTKILFTNSDREHAKKALMRLGIDENIFERIICFETLNPHLFSEDPLSPNMDQIVVLKPSPSAFHAAIRISGYDPHRMLFVDDSEKNVVAGKSLGLNTALVGKKVMKCEDADYLLEGIMNLREEVPEIWKMNNWSTTSVRA
ncbi:Pyrimidine 5'-nucleotidase [Zostera marina]|uniref:Pyrimidine 5'-nucleotidase n=1 Tax=Zostera marina TaxID=29655 RepID=A0A0K9PQ65_ZOSMR|nr:Pyrimidine 5'-nucleotidase [Zostera marina]